MLYVIDLLFVISIQAQVLELLRSVVLEPEQGSIKTRLLAAAILADLCPNPHILVRDFDFPVELKFVPLIMATFLAQVICCHFVPYLRLLRLTFLQNHLILVVQTVLL